MGVATSVRFRRLDRQGRPAGPATILDADRDAASRRAVAITGGGSPVLPATTVPRLLSRGAAASCVRGARNFVLRRRALPYFVTYDDSNLGHPDCELLELIGAGLRAHVAVPGTTLRECSDREAWSRVVGRTLHAPE